MKIAYYRGAVHSSINPRQSNRMKNRNIFIYLGRRYYNLSPRYDLFGGNAGFSYLKLVLGGFVWKRL